MLIVAVPTHAEAAPEPVTVCVDRYLAKLNHAAADIETVGKYGEACAALIEEQNVSDYSSASNAVLVNQRYNTNVLMWMVVLITLAGTVLAGVQLYWSYRLALAGKIGLATDTKMDASPNNLAITSSVVGVLILGLSLLFFIVFVWKIYPITLVGATSTTPSSAADATIPEADPIDAPAAAADPPAATTPTKP